jgi:hypothetical protein
VSLTVWVVTERQEHTRRQHPPLPLAEPTISNSRIKHSKAIQSQHPAAQHFCVAALAVSQPPVAVLLFALPDT